MQLYLFTINFEVSVVVVVVVISFTIENGWKKYKYSISQEMLKNSSKCYLSLMMRIIESTENKRDLEDDFVELHSEDSDTEQDISSEESEDELDMNEDWFFNSHRGVGRG